MIAGIENKIKSTNVSSVTSSVTPVSGKGADKIITKDALEIWQIIQGAGTVTIDFTTAITAELICLFNVICETSVKIETFDAGLVSIESKTVLTAGLTGLDILNTYFKLTSTTPIKRIVLTYAGATSSFETSTGSIWAGDIVDFGCLKSLIPRDTAADSSTITRGQLGSIKEEYNYQDYDFTTRIDLAFMTFRDDVIRPLVRAGFLKPRPFIFDVEPYFTTPETLLAGFDAGRIQYDVIDDAGIYPGQATLGILEVFGEVNNS